MGKPVLVVIMGVAGSGKTTVGERLAAALHCAFLEGDSLHPAANVEKMAHGIPLNDADRAPWLAAVRATLEASYRKGESMVAACSALKQKYRDFLGAAVPIAWVYLKGSEPILRARLEQRHGHFFHADLLASQFADLEEPSGAIVVDIAQTPDAITAAILRQLPQA